MKKHNKILLKQEKAHGIFNTDFLQKIKQKQFSGTLRVKWSKGDLKIFNLSSKLTFRIRTRRGPDDFDFFDDEFWQEVKSMMMLKRKGFKKMHTLINCKDVKNLDPEDKDTVEM